MRIGVDLDGVLRDILTPLCNLWERKTGISKTAADIVSWDLHQYMELDKAEMTADEFYKWWFSSHFIYGAAKPIPGSQEAIATLAEKHELIVVSNQPTLIAKRWSGGFLITYFPGRFSEVRFVSDKASVRVDALVDDGIHNLAGHPARHPVLFDQPWNRDESQWPGYRPTGWGIPAYRARGWDDVVNYFCGRQWK